MKRKGSPTPIIFAVVGAVALAGAGALMMIRPSGHGGGAGITGSGVSGGTHDLIETQQAGEAAANARLACTVTDSRVINPGVFEVACLSAPGYVVFNRSSGAVDAYDCDTMGRGEAKDAKGVANPAQKCVLPGNVDLKANLKPQLAAAGVDCTVTAARGEANQTATSHFFEAACSNRAGVMLEIPRSGKPVAQSCLDYAGGADACALTSEAELRAALGKLANAGGKTCEVTKFRYDGYAGRDLLYEVACSGRPGFLVQTDPHGVLRKTVSCAEVGRGLQHCTL